METTSSNPNITTLYPTNKTIIRHDKGNQSTKKPNPQSWKLETTFAASNLTEVEGKNNNVGIEEVEKPEEKEEMNDFKPSQHLGSFFDDDTAEVIKNPIPGPVVKIPESGFVSSILDDYSSKNKIPQEFYEQYKPFPYNYEDSTVKARPSWQEPMDSKPTVEVPTKLPAGGLYQSPITVKEKPNDSEGFELDINEEVKTHGIKKRGNPWQDILRLVTAFIPVGLIISALTPSVITIHNVDDNRDAGRPGLYRRRSDAVTDLAPISERCRRRLLCELQSDIHYTPSSFPHRRKAKHCYKIHCDDTEALWRMLRWLFTHKQPAAEHFT
ncbi:unnamed protein product [Arctia plantaginis]|uniref:Uncharacterized protein n=1 Tax=Arctia plantaginis TaxID=874455 RepID=A0A8S1A5P3_ARCPL|nr:unnamed protein product [Arctia plantaginis]